ncbi:sodium/glutamate symporter [Streptomyces sp. NPDC002754]
MSYSPWPLLSDAGLIAALLIAVVFARLALTDGLGLKGFGAAAALGTAFEANGWEGASSLGFTSATVGMLVGVVGGIILCNWGARRGHTSSVGRFETLPEEPRTGLVRDKDERHPTGNATTSPASIEPLGFQIAVIAALAAAAYGVSEWITGMFPSLMLPVFALALVLGLLLRAVVARTKAWAVGGAWAAVGVLALVLPWLAGWAPRGKAKEAAAPARESAGV